MQKVAAYLLERRDGMYAPEARTSEAAALREKVWEWLHSKGAAKGTTSGAYASEDGSNAKFTSNYAEDSGHSWSFVQLDEVTSTGRRFTAGVSVTTSKDSVVVYLSLEAGSSTSEISPVSTDAKCPHIVRTLLSLPGHWYHGASRIRPLQRSKGFEQGSELALELLSPERTLPWILVTEIAGNGALVGLESQAAYDLAGLANVARLDSEAAWGLTDQLGTTLSCYEGAVRIYWPRLTLKDDPFRHPLWTAGRLQSVGGQPATTLAQFRTQLRGLFMRTAALGVVRPRQIDEIRAGSAHNALATLTARASSVEDYRLLNEMYEAENSTLRASNREQDERIEALTLRVGSLEETKAALLARTENAELQLRYRGQNEVEIAPEHVPQQAEGDDAAPSAGDICFYKKTHSAPKHDIMVRVGDCGCNNWQNGHAGEKAKKGITKLAGRSDWAKVEHCGSCTGGGLWRVTWQ